jgi:hypothetical protein
MFVVFIMYVVILWEGKVRFQYTENVISPTKEKLGRVM